MADSSSKPEETEQLRAEAFGADVVNLDLTLWDMLSSAATQFPDREAIVSLWQPAEPAAPPQDPSGPGCLRWTYGRLRGRAERVAASLALLGCRPGMHLAAIFWNSAEWGLFLWAAARICMVFVPIDARAGDHDVGLMLAAVDPHVLVVQDADLADGLAFGHGQLRTGPVRIQCSSRAVDGWLRLDELALSEDSWGGETGGPATTLRDLPPAGKERSGDGTVLIIFTSGTTGAPKGCPHSNRNLISQTYNYDPSQEVDRWLVHTPVSHIFGINNALRAWRNGDSVVFASGRFDVDSTVRALVQEKCTIMSATPTLVKALLAHRDIPGPEALGISIVTLAGTSIGVEDIALCRRGLGARDAIQAYGMSEGGPLVSWARTDAMLADGYHPGVGKVLPGAAVRVCEPGGRRVLQRGEAGELHVSGSSVISSYLGGVDGDSFYTDAAGTWLMTGDQASMDADGVLHMAGRYKDLIIRGGENVHPGRIESALAEIPGLQAQVVGVPDSLAGQLVVAVVQLAPGTSKAQVSEKAGALGPKHAVDAVYTLDELGFESMPVTSLGKPKKGLLRDAVVQLRARPSEHELRQLTDALTATWETLTGCRPARDEKLSYFSDSITLLRYCDSVLRVHGQRLYLQDLAAHDTVEKQAKLLLDRGREVKSAVPREVGVSLTGQWNRTTGERPDATQRFSDATHPVLPTPPAASDEQLWEAARDTASALGLGAVEDVMTVRSSLQRMIAGQRPSSFHIRVVFRVAAAGPQIRRGLEHGLRLRPVLRAVACRPPGREPCLAVVAPHRPLFDRQLRELDAGSDDEARRLCGCDEAAPSRASGLMLAADIVSVAAAGRSYLALTYNHAAVDALFLLEWHRDLGQLIGGGGGGGAWTVDARSSYRLFADLFHQYRDSLPARAAVAFHVRRLRGISRLGPALWPPRRAPGWMVSDDGGAACAEARRRVRERVWQGAWARRAAEFGFPRRSRAVWLPGLPELRRRSGIEAAELARGAVAVFNAVQTGARFAVFTSWESGRSWPFVPGWIERLLPPPMAIDGPTVERVLNMVELGPGETLRGFLRRLAGEHERAVAHQHAPWDSIVSALGDEGPAAVDASFRQSFVWDVSMAMALPRSDGDPVLEPVARHDWADFGFCWNMFLVARDNILFVASWDTAQMNVDEVERHCDCMADVLRRLAKEANWDRPMGEVFALGRAAGF